jgi:hypothetical protein
MVVLGFQAALLELLSVELAVEQQVMELALTVVVVATQALAVTLALQTQAVAVQEIQQADQAELVVLVL